MDDKNIVLLFWNRDESAISETQTKYGGYLTKIAENILKNREDSEECVNDTYLRAWETMPPRDPVNDSSEVKPHGLCVYLSRITRTLSIDRWRRKNTQKRGGSEFDLSLDELAECVSVYGDPVHDESEMHRLTEAIEAYLTTRRKDERIMFLCRYYYADSVADIAGYFECTQSRVKSALHRMRLGLREHLTKEGFDL